MVDFQERDTRRGVEEFGLDSAGADDDPHEAHPADGAGADPDHHAHDAESVGAGVLTVTSTRTLDDDPSGDAIAASIEAAGHEVVIRELVADDYDRVQGAVDALVHRTDVDVVVTTGGTGVSPDDVTVEAIRPLFDTELPGFGELFRRLSFEQIGSRTVASRATAGIAAGVLVFCLPGSESAVRLGVDEIIAPEVAHLVGLVGREADASDG